MLVDPIDAQVNIEKPIFGSWGLRASINTRNSQSQHYVNFEVHEIHLFQIELTTSQVNLQSCLILHLLFSFPSYFLLNCVVFIYILTVSSQLFTRYCTVITAMLCSVFLFSTALIVGSKAVRWVVPQATKAGIMTANWSPAPTNIVKEDVSFLQLPYADGSYFPSAAVTNCNNPISELEVIIVSLIFELFVMHMGVQLPRCWMLYYSSCCHH